MSERDYKSFRNLVNNQVTPAKGNIMKTFFWENKRDVKKNWSLINSVLHKYSGNNKSDIK